MNFLGCGQTDADQASYFDDSRAPGNRPYLGNRNVNTSLVAVGSNRAGPTPRSSRELLASSAKRTSWGSDVADTRFVHRGKREILSIDERNDGSRDQVQASFSVTPL
jgi:hypothetical protein